MAILMSSHRFPRPVFWLLFLLMSSCFDVQIDPVPVLTFSSSNLFCNLESDCYNPVSSSIFIGIPTGNGTYLMQSGLISLSSSDPSVAEPNGNFIITKKTGECTITAIQRAAPGYNAEGRGSFRLIVLPKLDALPELTWYQEQFRDVYVPFYQGAGDSIVNPVINSILPGQKFIYSSSDASVASVNADGFVKCHTVGQATIKAELMEKPGVNRYAYASYKVIVDPTPVITFSEGSSYTCTMGSSETFANKWTTSIPAGGPVSVFLDTYFANIDFFGEIREIRKSGKTLVYFVQEAKHGVNARGVGIYELTILPPKPTLEFVHGAEYTCSTITGGCKNEVSYSYWGLFDYKDHISYASSDETIATVSDEGIVNPIRAGEVTITATLAEVPDKFQECTGSYSLTVIDYPIPVLELSYCWGGCSVTCQLGNNSYVCEMDIVSDVPQGGAIVYSCSDPSVATIDSVTGVITPIKIGQAMITATQLEVPGVNGAASKTMPLNIY